MAGDSNAHSLVRNPRCSTRLDAVFLENLILTRELQVLNNDTATRQPPQGRDIHSIIDLTMTSGAGPMCGEWRVE